jgi:hypothetical protein
VIGGFGQTGFELRVGNHTHFEGVQAAAQGLGDGHEAVDDMGHGTVIVQPVCVTLVQVELELQMKKNESENINEKRVERRGARI